jgi:hypothetical protein
MDEVREECRRLHNEEVYDLYFSPNIRVIKSRRVRWMGHVADIGEGRGAYGVLVGKFEKKRTLGRHMHRFQDNIEMDLQEIGWRAWAGLI